jgi:hypothetical protein
MKDTDDCIHCPWYDVCIALNKEMCDKRYTPIIAEKMSSFLEFVRSPKFAEIIQSFATLCAELIKSLQPIFDVLCDISQDEAFSPMFVPDPENFKLLSPQTPSQFVLGPGSECKYPLDHSLQMRALAAQRIENSSNVDKSKKKKWWRKKRDKHKTKK